MFHTLRNLLAGGGKPQQDRRRLPPPGPCPNIGATIVRRDASLRVSRPIPQECWDWLVLAGWREVRMARNRRRYRRLPADALEQLLRAAPGEREAVHRHLLDSAAG